MDNTPVGGISERHRWSKRILKGVLSIVIVALVCKYQVNRPKVPLVYYTSDPYDTFRGKLNYTCGCTLPATIEARIQAPQNPTEDSNAAFSTDNNSSWKNTNVCLLDSATANVNVLMYPNIVKEGDPKFTQVGLLDDILQDAYGSEFTTNKGITSVPGILGVKRAHDLSWHNSIFLEQLSSIYLTRAAAQNQLKARVDFLMNAVTASDSADDTRYIVSPFLDFPTSYVNLALAYNCTDCSNCPLEKVNHIFKNISGDSNSTWGSCDYWWNVNHCESQNWYTAKCVLYPTEELPLNYAIESFLGGLTNMTGKEHIFTPEDLADKNVEDLIIGQKSMTSFSANVLHMDFSKVENGSVQLNFFELEKYSAAWLAILNAFPSLDSECSQLKPVEVANGTAICNVFTNAKTKAVDRNCIVMSNKTQCEVDYIHINNSNVNVTVDAADKTLWRDYNVASGDWANLMCMNYSNVTVPPYKVLWKTAPAMQNSSLNRFLESKNWAIDWARNSGVCINSYKNVSRQNFEDSEGNENTTAFMETKCHGMGYCWLTGRYHQLSDTPDQEWHNLSSLDNPPKLFVCYSFEAQNVCIWLLFICAILFGWLGTADLICEWIVFPVSRLIWHNFNKQFHRADVNSKVTDSAIVSSANGNSELQGVVVMRHLILKSCSDTAVILGRKKPDLELPTVV